MGNLRILVINPGSTSTKVAVFENEKEMFSKTLRHQAEELAPFNSITDQYEFRMDVIIKALEENDVSLDSLDGAVGRGGLLYPIASGTYAVNDLMLEHLQTAIFGEHASNLGALIANAVGKKLNIPAFIVDPVVVDEFSDFARLSGHPKFTRRSIFHALNQKAVARKTAEKIGKPYEECNLVVVHLGGGISVGAHEKGKVVDVNNALNGDGPYTPERSGGLPVGDLAALCFSGETTHAEVKKMIKGKGGVHAYLETTDLIDVENRAIAKEPEAELIFFGMAYQVAKEIGAYAAVLKGKIDGIVMSGGIAYAKPFVDFVKDYCEWMAPFYVFPGEAEMEALALGGLRVLQGKEEARIYDPKK